MDGVYAIGDCATISASSLMNHLDEAWNKADKNADGKLDKHELQARASGVLRVANTLLTSPC